ncbi:metal-dependent transcriptional regulator [Fredinandcohnia sp. QZ13]|uniref:metal-dependent transcriptional regulator n=1 Tax=Fredinandcohnia sp. QZ13 TaxID=3073144 RepID=UPI0028536F50|nr:metal-dependent transcriptional regulator [Fredinandcohnia sp. QZ13]MDR4889893.1 metal-dependent transcriptional regulator [Fredinandcohnia sp. QZ13]
MISAKRETYLLEIYANLNEEGFTRVSQLAKSLNVSVPSASKMAKKLKEDGLIEFQRYGNLTLTEKGNRLAKELALNHEVLSRFFQLIKVEDEEIEKEVKKIESHISSDVIKKLDDFLTNR